MKINDTTMNDISFITTESGSSHTCSFNEKTSSLHFNALAGVIVYLSVFSLFVLSFISVLFFLGIEADLYPIIFAIMLSSFVGLTAFILSYASAMIFE